MTNQRCEICTNKDSELCDRCVYGIRIENHYKPIYHTYRCRKCGIKWDSEKGLNKCPQCGCEHLGEILL